MAAARDPLDPFGPVRLALPGTGRLTEIGKGRAPGRSCCITREAGADAINHRAIDHATPDRDRTALALPPGRVAADLGTNPVAGLPEAEAAGRLAQFGENVLVE